MSGMSDVAIELLDQYGDIVDIYYTQFLEVAFFLKIAASEKMAVAFIKRKLPNLNKDDIHFIIGEITEAHRDEL